MRPAAARRSAPFLRAGAPENIKVLSCAELLTDSIRSIFSDRSVSDVFGGENQLFERG